MTSTNYRRFGAVAFASSGLLSFGLGLSAVGQTLPIAGDPRAAAAADQAERRAMQARDGIKGVREQDTAARRTANELNRDARQEARQQAASAGQTDGNLTAQSPATAQGQVNGQTQANGQAEPASASLNANLRGADLGLWLSNPQGNNGLVVADLAANSPFSQVGLKEGDRIVSINGRPVANERQFVQMLLAPGQMNQNQTTNLVVMRNGQQQNIALQPATIAQGVVAADPFYQTGLTVDQTSANSIAVRNVFPRTPAYYAGLRAGDVITGLNGQPITLDALTQALASTGNTDLGLAVNRNGQTRQLTLATNSDGSLRTAQRAALTNTNGADVNGGALSGTTGSGTTGAGTGVVTPTGVTPAGTGLTTAGTSALDGRTSVGGAATSAAGFPQTTTNPASQAGFPTSPAALGNPTSPSLSVQRPIGERTSVPGARTSVPGLPTAGPTAGTTNPAGVITGTTSSQGAVVPGVAGGNTGLPPSATSQGGNIGDRTSATRAFGSPSAAGATGTTGGAGATAGGVGATGGTGAIPGGAGSTAGPSGGAIGSGAAGAGLGGTSGAGGTAGAAATGSAVGPSGGVIGSGAAGAGLGGTGGTGTGGSGAGGSGGGGGGGGAGAGGT